MSIIRFLFLLLSLYFLYRIVFHLIIPVFMVTRKMKQQVRNFNERMQPEQPEPAKNTQATDPVVKSGEYIDFEEVK